MSYLMLRFGRTILEKKIRGFRPLTANSKKRVARKLALKKILEEKIDLNEAGERCRKEKIAVDLCFYLNSKTTATGRTKKDLDNMMKLVFDVLKDQVINDGKEARTKGLGLISDDSDIHQIRATKIFVKTDEDEGMDIKISRWQNK